MSWLGDAEPDTDHSKSQEVAAAIFPRTVDIGGFEVHRALPAEQKRLVGPFIFWDQMGSGSFGAGSGVDVRPHPHIGLATVTYLFDGSLDHRDSLGNKQRIVPGDVNLMYAGAGIVHSERTGKDVRCRASSLHGIQSWMAQPRNHEDGTPGFSHVAKEDITVIEGDGISCRLVLGELFGASSPIASQWQTLYAELRMTASSAVKIPKTVEERAISLVSGTLKIAGRTYPPATMIILRPGCDVVLRAVDDCHAMLLGGAAMDGPRYIWWNLVSSSLEKIKAAAREWQNDAFPSIPGDDEEFIPLPDLPFPREEMDEDR